MFEYLLSIPTLRDYAIMRANKESSNGALHGEQWEYWMGINCINKAAQKRRIMMLKKFVEIDAGAVANSAVLLSAVDGKEIDQNMLDLLVNKTKFKVSRSTMYAILFLLDKADNSTVEKILAKFAADAKNQDSINQIMLQIACAVIEEAGAFSQTPSKTLTLLQFPMVKTALAADQNCTVLKNLIEYASAFSRDVVEQTFNEYLKRGYIQYEARSKNGVLFYAIDSQLEWLVESLLAIPEVVEALQKDPDIIRIAQLQLKEAGKHATSKVTETAQNNDELQTIRQADLANAERIMQQLQNALQKPSKLADEEKSASFTRVKHKL